MRFSSHARSPEQQSRTAYRFTSASYIDLKKAYDRVHRPTLWKILRRLGLPHGLLNFIMSLYDGAEATVQAAGLTSTNPINLENGLKQGGLLSAPLFKVYYATIIRAARHQFETCNLQLGIPITTHTTNKLLQKVSNATTSSPQTHIYEILYADDTLLFATSEMALQALVTILSRMCATFGQCHGCISEE